MPPLKQCSAAAELPRICGLPVHLRPPTRWAQRCAPRSVERELTGSRSAIMNAATSLPCTIFAVHHLCQVPFMPRTIIEKLWDSHIVHEQPGVPTLLFIDLHLVHEVTS